MTRYGYIMFDSSRDNYKCRDSAFVTTDLSKEDQSSLPTHSECQESQGILVLKIH